MYHPLYGWIGYDAQAFFDPLATREFALIVGEGLHGADESFVRLCIA